MHTAELGHERLPRNLEVMHVYDRMQAAFPGGQIPAVVVVHAKDVTAPAVAAADRPQLERQALATGKAEEPITVDVSPDQHVAQVEHPDPGRRAPTTPRWPRWRTCATTSCRRPSAARPGATRS